MSADSAPGQTGQRGKIMKFYGREDELQALRKLLSDACGGKGSRMACVYGRRRVGKTTLVLKALESADIPVFNFFASRRYSAASLTRSWLARICEAYGVRRAPAVSSPADAIAYAMELSEDKPCAVFIDECQELSAAVPEFWSELQHAWDLNKDRSRVFLVFSGSIVSALEKLFGSESEPLFGRLDCQILLRPFPTRVVRQIFLEESGGSDPADLLFTYAATGGVARYLELLSQAGAMTAQGGVRYIFSPEGEWLRSEGALYLSNEFRAEAPAYTDILRAISMGRTKWAEIQAGCEETISPYMKRLEDFRILKRIQPAFEKKSARQVRYGIADPFFRLWLRFIDPQTERALAEAGRWGELQARVLADLPAFLGRTLEEWFRRAALEDGPWTEAGSWWDRRGENEIDLVAADTVRKRLLFGEAKLSPDKYSEAKLRLKAERFLESNPRFASWPLEFRGLFPSGML